MTLAARQRRATERKAQLANLMGMDMAGYVQCECGSIHVTGHDRRDRKGRLVQVLYRCHDCSATSLTPRRSESK